MSHEASIELSAEPAAFREVAEELQALGMIDRHGESISLSVFGFGLLEAARAFRSIV